MPTDPPRHILIAGPTASGKSALALALAERLDRPIVNADALQVYADWRVLTARPSDDEVRAVPHRLYGHVGFETAYSVGDWLRDVDGLLTGGKPLIFVGGTGLYLTSLTHGLADIPATPEAMRQQANDIFAAEGIEFFQDYLRTHDPDYWKIVDQSNPMRLQRAWEVQESTGRRMSAWRGRPRKIRVSLGNSVPLALMPDPKWLNARIAARFDAMMADGVLDEVRQVLPKWNPALPASKALGAAELRSHLLGEVDLEVAVDRAKIATRQFAKRQRTWLRSNMGDWRQVAWDGSQMSALVDEVASAV